VIVVIVAAAVGLDDSVVQRSNRIAFTGYFRSDALVDLRGQARIDENGEFRLSQHVDESGRDNFAGGVNRARAWRGHQIADGGDLSIANAQVSRIPRGPGAVDDASVGDDKVESRRLGESQRSQ